MEQISFNVQNDQSEDYKRFSQLVVFMEKVSRSWVGSTQHFEFLMFWFIFALWISSYSRVMLF